MQRLRDRLTYANVVATMALFVALGGSSYAALTLPRNSVGAKQLKRDSVSKSELTSGSVRSSEIRNGSITVADVSPNAQAVLRGPAGPPGPAGVSLRSSIDVTGAQVAGNATLTEPAGPGKRLISFGSSVAGCTPTASLARIGSDPGAGSIVTAIEGSKIAVEMYNSAGVKANLPFNLLVAC